MQTIGCTATQQRNYHARRPLLARFMENDMSTKTVMDLNKLDALASAADPHGDVHLVTHYRLSANLGAEEAWRRAATPAAIKPLIELARTSLAPSPKLEDIEQYRVQMAAISTASFGYWKESDGIQPDYDTVPLRDVARLFAKYDHLYKFREQVRVMVAMLKNREWAEDLGATGDASDLQGMITDLVGHHTAVQEVIGCFNAAEVEGLETALSETTDARLKDLVERRLMHALYAAQSPTAKDMRHTGATWTKDSVGKLATTIAEAVAKNADTVPQLTFPHIFLHLCDALIEREPTDMEQHQAEMRKVTSWPEANRAAAEIVAFSPPPMVRDALYRDYAVPAKEGGQE